MRAYRLGHINNWDKTIFVFSSLLSLFISDESPDFVQVNCGQMLGVLREMVMPHTNLSEVTRMELIKVDA